MGISQNGPKDRKQIYEEYPYDVEKKLRVMIAKRDKSEAQDALHVLLEYLFQDLNTQLNIVKFRLTELLTVMSRAAIGAGADVEQIFSLNNHYIYEIEKYDTASELTVTLANATNRFIDFSFDVSDVEDVNLIHKAVVYIKNNYNKKITLDDVARHVHLSKSYLCKVFKAATSYNVSSYINIVKVEKIKELLMIEKYSLMDIVNEVGFDDQSYFTKVFKKYTGMSPSRYRKVMLGINFKDDKDERGI